MRAIPDQALDCRPGSRRVARQRGTPHEPVASEQVGPTLSSKGRHRLEARTHSAERPRSQDAQLRLLAAHVQDHAVFLLDAAGHVTSWNAGAQRMWGYTSREILGAPLSVFYPEEEAARGPSEALAEAARAGSTEVEGPRRRRDGSTLLAVWVLRAVRSRAGRLHGFAVVARDVTELRRAEEERERLARAQEVARIQTAFLAALAHELRTPVASLRLEVESLVRQLRRDEMRPELERLVPRLAGLTRQSDRLARLIESFLSLPRFGADRAGGTPADLDAVALFREVADELKAEPALATVPVTVTAAGSGIIRADPALFQLVAWTLLANAFRYGAGAPVEVRIARAGGEARIEVRDGGIGIAPEDQARIFEPFERAVPPTAYAGLGLGLWIARQIAAAHGGSLGVESAPGQGSTFVLKIPQPQS